MSFLDSLPLATIISLAGIVGAVIALINKSIDFETFMISIGAVNAGAGVVGVARAQSNKGVK
jgi:hypothetical protein